MGRQSFYNKEQSSSMSQAYRNACADADDEYGHQQGYSGQINVTNGYTDRTSHYKASGLSLSDYIEKYQNKFDGEACGICIKEPKANTNKIKSVVKHEVFKGTRKWGLFYVVEPYGSDRQLVAVDNKADAVKFARNHTEKTREATTIRIERRLIGSKARVATIEYKGSTNEQEGTYVFFGLARC